MVLQKPGFLRVGEVTKWPLLVPLSSLGLLDPLLEPDVLSAGVGQVQRRLPSGVGDQLPRSSGKGNDFIERAILCIYLTTQFTRGLLCLMRRYLLISPFRICTNQHLPPGQPGPLPSWFNFLGLYPIFWCHLQPFRIEKWTDESGVPASLLSF